MKRNFERVLEAVTSRVYFDVEIEGEKSGRVVIGLFGNTGERIIAPVCRYRHKTSTNFFLFDSSRDSRKFQVIFPTWIDV